KPRSRPLDNRPANSVASGLLAAPTVRRIARLRAASHPGPRDDGRQPGVQHRVGRRRGRQPRRFRAPALPAQPVCLGGGSEGGRSPPPSAPACAGPGGSVGMALLTLEKLHLNFGGVAALAGVTLEVNADDFFAIIGPNGAGKTSIFNCISGIYTPSRGRIVFNGQDITRVKPHRRAKLRIARTFQNIALFRGMTVLDNV